MHPTPILTTFSNISGCPKDMLQQETAQSQGVRGALDANGEDLYQAAHFNCRPG